MTNEELKKKIVKVLKETINWTTDYSIPIGIVYKSELDKIADALIAAGIGDVKTAQEIGASATAMAVLEAAKAEHRAEVAERAGRIIQRDMARVFDISNPRVCELIANIWDLAKKQAEKDLAEEGEDE